MLKKLAIVGRPNVGKSALFNRIAEKRIAIVDEAEGVTRDRLYTDVEAFGFTFRMIDTGGVDPRSSDRFKTKIIEQARLAIEEADTLVMVVDSRVGVTTLDEELAHFLLKTGKPLTLAINKIDGPSQEFLVHAFHKLGIQKMVAVSAIQGFQIAELLEQAWEGITFSPPEVKNEVTKITIVGRPNVGKSTLINALLNEERSIVSTIAGTTRDSIDIPFFWENKEYQLIDTAGIKKKKAEKDVIEKFAALRTKKAIERSDIALLVLDATSGLTEQEKRIINDIEEVGKGCIILLNKWDLVKGYRMEHCLTALRETSPFLAGVPIIFISALNGRNLDKLFPEIENVRAGLSQRLSTHQLNKFLEKSMQLNHPPMIKGKRLRIYYITQVDTKPPKFILFVNNVALMSESYRKYLINQFRKTFGFPGAPLIFHLKGKIIRTPAKRKEDNALKNTVEADLIEDDFEEEYEEDDDFCLSEE